MSNQTTVQSSHKESGNFSCSAFHSRSLVIASASSDHSLMKRADSARTLLSGGVNGWTVRRRLTLWRVCVLPYDSSVWRHPTGGSGCWRTLFRTRRRSTWCSHGSPIGRLVASIHQYLRRRFSRTPQKPVPHSGSAWTPSIAGAHKNRTRSTTVLTCLAFFGPAET
jgi:hypothetical protein